jgi:hypothetical protein
MILEMISLLNLFDLTLPTDENNAVLKEAIVLLEQ